MHEASQDQRAIDSLEAFVQRLCRKGVMLWMEEAGLRYRAPKGVLTAEDRQALSRANEEIGALLERQSRSPHRSSSVTRNGGVRWAPLSFSQMAHWYERLRYGGGQPIRHIAAAFRLQGSLRVELLKESVVAVGRHHDALRTRIVHRDGMPPLQEVSERYCSDLDVISLTTVSEAQRSIELDRQIQHAMVDARDYATSPLFKAVLLAIDPSEHVLVLALEHIISDLASLRILFEDIFAAYTQLLDGRPIELPRVPVQFTDHATRLCARSLEVLARVCRRFESSERTRFPRDFGVGPSHSRAGLGAVRFVIDRDLGNELRAWARRHGTTAVIATLTAYAALLLRWCQVSETVILFMIDGRTSADLERTIGFLAFDIYIAVTLGSRSSFLDLLEVVTEGYCTARDDTDFGYARAKSVRPEFTRNPAVNWSPAGAAASGILAFGTEGVLSWSRVKFSDPSVQLATQWDEEPGVILSEQDGNIVGDIFYASNMLSDRSMSRFAANVTEFLTAMIRTPACRVMDVELK